LALVQTCCGKHILGNTKYVDRSYAFQYGFGEPFFTVLNNIAFNNNFSTCGRLTSCTTTFRFVFVCFSHDLDRWVSNDQTTCDFISRRFICPTSRQVQVSPNYRHCQLVFAFYVPCSLTSLTMGQLQRWRIFNVYAIASRRLHLNLNH